MIGEDLRIIGGEFRDRSRDDAEEAYAESISDFRRRHGIKAARILTVMREEDGAWMMERLEPIIASRVVVEIGAGCGTLALMMARVAKHVFAIEADIGFTKQFLVKAHLKPTNLTWIFDTAQSMVPLLKADVSVVVTGSDEDALRVLAGQFAQTVVMPWQDWNKGKAVVPGREPWRPTVAETPLP